LYTIYYVHFHLHALFIIQIILASKRHFSVIVFCCEI